MPTFSKELKVALEAIEEASTILLSYSKRGASGRVSKKGRVERVSEADLKAETRIRDILSGTFPDYNISGEEYGETDLVSDYKWYVDPLCGSNEFIHGLPEYGVSIALTYKDELVLGACSLPEYEEVFWAEKGKGAFCNGKPISVSETSELNESIITTHVSVKFENIKPAVKLLSKIGKYNMLIPGAFPYSACNLARGRTDGHVELNVRPVHRLAGTMIILEAGGRWTKIDGGQATVFDNNIILTNGVIHDEILELLD